MPSHRLPMRRREPRAAGLSLRVLAAAGLALACHDEPIAGPVVPGTLAKPHADVTTTAGPAVNSLADPGDGVCDAAECTLREAIAAADAGDEISFDAALAGGTIVLGSGQLVIDKDLTVSGPGPAELTIDANNASRAFAVSEGVSALIQGITMARGFWFGAPGGSTVLNDGMLQLRDCRIRNGNLVEFGRGVVLNRGTLAVRGCTFENNGDEAIADVTTGTLMIANSTISGHTSINTIFSLGTLMLLNSTISGNTASADMIRAASVVIRNSTLLREITLSPASGMVRSSTLTISGSILVTADGVTCNATIVNQGHNIFGSNTCSRGPLDQVVNHLDLFTRVLAPLADNGGPTPTHALLDPAVTGFANPALDQGSCVAAALTADQRGEPRPADFPGVANADDGCDVGAFELQPPPPCTIEDLVEHVEALEAGGVLNKGQANGLRGKLDQVERLLDRGKVADARAVLADFRGQVAGLRADGVLSADQAADLDGCAGDVDAGLVS